MCAFHSLLTLLQLLTCDTGTKERITSHTSRGITGNSIIVIIVCLFGVSFCCLIGFWMEGSQLLFFDLFLFVSTTFCLSTIYVLSAEHWVWLIGRMIGQHAENVWVTCLINGFLSTTIEHIDICSSIQQHL